MKQPENKNDESLRSMGDSLVRIGGKFLGATGVLGIADFVEFKFAGGFDRPIVAITFLAATGLTGLAGLVCLNLAAGFYDDADAAKGVIRQSKKKRPGLGIKDSLQTGFQMGRRFFNW